MVAKFFSINTIVIFNWHDWYIHIYTVEDFQQCCYLNYSKKLNIGRKLREAMRIGLESWLSSMILKTVYVDMPGQAWVYILGSGRKGDY